MLKLGQELWWVKKNTGEQGAVKVIGIHDDHFEVSYKGKRYQRPYTILGKKLFFEPQLSEKKLSCDTCFFRVSEECMSLRSIPCEDYRAVPNISKTEKENWPQYGDATAFRLHDRKRFR